MSRKKMFISSLGAMMAASALVPAATMAAEKPFPDVAADHDYYDLIHKLANDGVIKGFTDGEFKMEASMSRAQAAVMIARITGADLENAPSTPFKDVKKDVWYTDAVNALYHQGVIDGYVDGTFKPHEKIKRGEFAKLVVEAFNIPTRNQATPYTDIPEGVWYEKVVNTLYGHGLISPEADKSFAGSQEMKRGDAAALLSYTADTFADVAFNLSILHQNDTHARLDNVPQTVTAVKEARAKNPDALLLHAGDVFSGSLYFNEFNGQADLALMNLMNIDAMTFGNHEFDLGSSAEGHQALVDFIIGANFPFVSANIDFSADERFTGLFSDLHSSDPKNGKIYNGIIKEIDGEKVGIFGLTTEETVDIASPGKLKFENYLAEAEKAVAAFEGMGVNKIIALTHIGFDDNSDMDNDKILAASVAGIDIIVGGHTHTKLDQPYVVAEDLDGNGKEPTLIVHASQYNEYLGTLDVLFDENGVIVSHGGELIAIGDQVPDAKAEAILKPYKEHVAKVSQDEIGVTLAEALETPRTGGDNTLPSVRKNETILGNIITDGMLAKAREYNEDVVMAFQNGGGIRASIEAGPITVGDVIIVLPFGNTLATMEISGADLIKAFEHALKEYPAESGGFLHIAGGKLVYDPSKPVGERVVSLAYENADGTYTDIVSDGMYTVATNYFTAKGGDGYDMFAAAYEDNRVTDLGLSDWENLREQLVKIGTDGIPTEVEGRITKVK